MLRLLLMLYSRQILTPSVSLSVCRCPSAFFGNRCQLPNPCHSSPCKNAGTCHAVVRGNTVDYTCACRLGFTDQLCLTPEENVCLSSPCRNGGTCDLLTLTEYKCRCPPGWSGEEGTVTSAQPPAVAEQNPCLALAIFPAMSLSEACVSELFLC